MTGYRLPFQRLACSEWPAILNPAPGCMPLSWPVTKNERVLHVALRSDFESQPGLEKALRSTAVDYLQIDWPREEARRFSKPADELVLRARKFKPTLVFMQLQRKTSITGDTIRRVHKYAPNAVVVNWDGDQMYEPDDPRFACFYDIGAEADASLTTNTTWQPVYKEKGVRRPGYLAIGTDDRWSRRKPITGVPEIVFLANAYQNQPMYDRRRAIAQRYMDSWGDKFAVYGYGWKGPATRPFVLQGVESDVYASSKVALVMSNHNNLGRYHSDRLIRAMRSGAVCMVECVPDMEGLGLVEAENCFFWSTEDSLYSLTERLLKTPEVELEPVRAAAAALIDTYHTWDARMGELLAIVHAVREARSRS